jgi:hypothetical protein
MRKRLRIDPLTADRIVGGALHADDAPAELAKVASLFAAATQDSPVAAADPSFLAALAAEVHANPAPAALTPRRDPVLKKLLTVKAGVLAGVLVFGATGAAAATDSLPDTAQHGVATAAKHIGVNLPDSANDHARDATSKDKGHHDGTDSDDSTEAKDNHGAEVSDVAHNTETTGSDHGAAVCDVASRGKCTEHRGSGDDHGQSGTHENDGDEHSTTTAVTTQDEQHDGQDDAADDAGENHGHDGGNSGSNSGSDRGESGHGSSDSD